MRQTQGNKRKIDIRPAAVAGMFYPSEAAELDASLESFIHTETSDIPPPKAIIAPHAGYVYSGPVAASVYTGLTALRDTVKRVVLLGPAHRVYVEGVALPTHTHFATPLGNIPLDVTALEELSALPFTEFNDAAHRQEHSLEVHLPFLQKVFADFQLIPLVIGNAKPEQVAEILEKLWGGKETLIVISSDLSHYHPYTEAKTIDAETTRLIETFDYQHIGPEQACGCMPMRGLLKIARDKNMKINTLDLRNSGDTAGSRDRVVGYGSYALFETCILDDETKKTVFDVIHCSIESGLDNGKEFKPDINNYQGVLQKPYAIFVTLNINGRLRGCIGTTDAHMSLIEASAHYAYAAAFSDPRFPKLSREEYSNISISLSILTPATAMTFSDEADLLSQLQPGRDGLIIEKGHRRATFLPVVWESLGTPEQFLSELKRKAGINHNETPDRAWRYKAEYYSE